MHVFNETLICLDAIDFQVVSILTLEPPEPVPGNGILVAILSRLQNFFVMNQIQIMKMMTILMLERCVALVEEGIQYV